MNRNREQELDQLRQLRLSGSKLSLESMYTHIREREQERAPLSWVVGVCLLLFLIIGANWTIIKNQRSVPAEKLSLSVPGLVPENSIYDGGSL